MKIKKLGVLGVPVLALVAVLPLAATAGGAQHVSWDIIKLEFTPLITFNPGGFAEAKAPKDTGTHTASDSRIRLTGSGTFVAPGGGNGGSGAVTGGGTWQTFDASGASTGSGTYEVTGLVSWEFANLQATPAGLTDNTGDIDKRANGTAVLRIEYQDGTRGVLMVACHGPGAPDGIVEGIAVTKGFVTYDLVQTPLPGVDANRTIFHVR